MREIIGNGISFLIYFIGARATFIYIALPTINQNNAKLEIFCSAICCIFAWPIVVALWALFYFAPTIWHYGMMLVDLIVCFGVCK